MAYVEYSSHWSIDQFFTYLEANQLGANSKHIVDNFSVEHNWNASTADGTHKNSSILGDYINKTIISNGSLTLPNNTTYIMPVGLYYISGASFVDLFYGGAWHSAYMGLHLCDGVNARVRNSSGDYLTFYYAKF